MQVLQTAVLSHFTTLPGAAVAYKIYFACSVRLLLSYRTLQLLRVTTLFSFWARSEPESRIGFSRDIISNPGLHGPVDFSLQLYLRSGAEDEIRTRDILLGRQALWPSELLPHLVRITGLEPARPHGH